MDLDKNTSAEEYRPELLLLLSHFLLCSLSFIFESIFVLRQSFMHPRLTLNSGLSASTFKCWDYRCVPAYSIYAVLGLTLRASYRLGQDSTK